MSVRAVHEALAVVVADIAFLACAEEADGAVAAAATMVTSLEQACGCGVVQVCGVVEVGVAGAGVGGTGVGDAGAVGAAAGAVELAVRASWESLAH